jgi:hypothetical protein
MKAAGCASFFITTPVYETHQGRSTVRRLWIASSQALLAMNDLE